MFQRKTAVTLKVLSPLHTRFMALSDPYDTVNIITGCSEGSILNHLVLDESIFPSYEVERLAKSPQGFKIGLDEKFQAKLCLMSNSARIFPSRKTRI